VNIGEGFFDSTIDAHGKLMSCPAEERCAFLRAYMNARLLFFPKVYLTDATINNNGAFRQLIMPEKGNGYLGGNLDLPCDYAELVKAGVIVAAIRDDVPRDAFSAILLDRQKNHGHSDLPPRRYTEVVQELFSAPKAVVAQFNLNDVAALFENKAKSFLRQTYADDKNIDRLRVRLADELETMPKVDFNGLLTRLEQFGVDKDSFFYKVFKEEFSKCYNNNVPQSLNLNYQAIVGGEQYKNNNIPVFEYGVSQRYVFDTECLAYLPSKELLNALTLSERYKFVRQFGLYQSGEAASGDALITAYERYVRQLDRFFSDCFTRAALTAIQERPQRPLYIKVLNSTAMQLITIGLGMIPVLGNAINLTSLASLFFVSRQEKKEKDRELFEKRLANLAQRSVIIAKEGIVGAEKNPL
jgi:hypothetical protein